ncbi:MAG: class I SAM-dependent methyltransferase [Candidatus Sericytochromatia bacterium]
MQDDRPSLWSGTSEDYQRFRQPIPATMLQALKRLAGLPLLERVVDLGAGTGLSTRAWAEDAQEIIGVEPESDMLTRAQAHTPQPHIRYLQRYAHDTGLPSDTADIVCAASAIHWMEPVATLREVLRILRPQGLFAFVGPSHPPLSPSLVIDAAYFELFRVVARWEHLLPPVEKWSWNDFSALIEAQKCFALKRFFSVHQALEWTAQDYLNWLSTVPQLQRLVSQGPSEVAEHFDQFTEILKAQWGKGAQTCLFVYNARVYQNKQAPAR